MHRSDVIFARFDNIGSNNNDTSNANEMIETGGSDGNSDDGTVEVDLHFGTDQSIENVNRAFNNPMFDANISSSSSTAAAILTTSRQEKIDGSEMREEKL